MIAPPLSRAAHLSAKICGVALLLIAGWVVASTLLAIHQARFAGPVGDFWRFLPFLEAFERGEAVWPYLWEIHGGHRLVVPRLFYLAEYEWFGGQNVFLLTTSVALQACAASLLSAVVWRARSRLTWETCVLAIAFVWVAAFSASQIDNFVRPWNLHQFLPPAAVGASLAGWAMAASASGRARAAWLAACIAAAAVATLSMANGMLVWPVLVGMSVVAGQRHAAVVLGVGAVCAVGGYLIGFPVSRSPTLRPLQALDGLLLLLGTPWSWNSPNAGRLTGGVGILGGLALGILHLRSGRRAPPWDAIPIGLCTFYGASMAMTMVFRSHAIFREAWAKPHYQTLVLAYWSALLVALWLRLPKSSQPALVARAGVALAAVAWVGVVLVPAHRLEARRVEEYGAEARRAHLAIAAGVPARSEYYDVLPWGDRRRRRDTLVEHRAFLERQRLGPYRGAPAEWLARGSERAFPPAPVSHCDGSVDEILVTAAPRWLRLEGSAWDLEARVVPRHLIVQDAEGRIVGIGQARARRAPLRLAAPDRRWIGYARSSSRLVVSAVLEDGTACTLLSVDRRDSRPTPP